MHIRSKSLNLLSGNYLWVGVVTTFLLICLLTFYYVKFTHRKDYIYYLRNDNGNLNLVRADINTGQSIIVVPSSGKENTSAGFSLSADTTAILARPDWKYVVLRSQRDNNYTKLYVFDENNGKLTAIDSDKASYQFAGWLNGRFIYVSSKGDVQYPSSGTSTIKSYDPKTNKSTTIVPSTDRLGAPYIIESRLIYGVNTETSGQIYSWGTDSSQPTKLYEVQGPGIFTNNIYNPDKLYFSYYGENGSAKYLSYTNGKVSETTEQLANNQTFKFYIASPSAKKTTWYEKKDGKNNIYIGDSNGNNGKLAAILQSDEKPYAWYGENTLIISKDGSVLYKLKKRQLIDISNYTASPKGFDPAMAGYPGASYGYAGMFDY